MTDEEKKAIEDLKEVVELYNDKCLITTEDDFKSIEILLNLIEKKSKEIEELKEDSCCMTNCVRRDKERLFLEDKIKAKIEPVLKQLERKMEEEYNKYGNSREYQDVVDAYNFLQSLLEKE